MYACMPALEFTPQQEQKGGQKDSSAETLFSLNVNFVVTGVISCI